MSRRKTGNDILADRETAVYLPPLEMRLADGSWLIKAGKPVIRASAAKTSRWTGVSTKTLSRLADAGYITRGWYSPFSSYYFPAEVEELLRKTEAEPDYWNDVRTQAFLQCAYPRDRRDRRERLEQDALFHAERAKRAVDG